jgi:hypothetical protein
MAPIITIALHARFGLLSGPSALFERRRTHCVIAPLYARIIWNSDLSVLIHNVSKKKMLALNKSAIIGHDANRGTLHLLAKQQNVFRQINSLLDFK